jgi:hypothetical protein
MGEHEWIRDPEYRGEGLTCRFCGVTEAEMEGMNGRMDRCADVPCGLDECDCHLYAGGGES